MHSSERIHCKRRQKCTPVCAYTVNSDKYAQREREREREHGHGHERGPENPGNAISIPFPPSMLARSNGLWEKCT